VRPLFFARERQQQYRGISIFSIPYFRAFEVVSAWFFDRFAWLRSGVGNSSSCYFLDRLHYQWLPLIYFSFFLS